MTTRVYSVRQITVATLIGGPLAGAWLLRENFKLFGKLHEGRTSLIVGILVAAAILSLGWLLPDHSVYDDLQRALPMAYTLGAYKYAQMSQKEDIERHHHEGVSFRSWWGVVGVGIACLIAMLAIIIATATLFSHSS